MKQMMLSAALLAALYTSGCTTSGENPEGGNGKPGDTGEGNTGISTPRDLEQQKIEVLRCLEAFEGRDVALMEEAGSRLLEMEQDKIVSADIIANVRKFQQPSTRHAALERLRFTSRVARTLLLLEFDKPEAEERQEWVRCRDKMIQLGPEAVVRFTGVLIVRFPTNPGWCRGMLMDLCVKPGAVAQDAVLEALNFEGVDQPGALDRSLLDDNTREGLASVLVYLPDPPVQKIRQCALEGPLTTRRAFATLLGKNRAKDEKTGHVFPAPDWCTEILALQLEKDAAWQVRAEAATSLGAAGDPVRCIPALTAGLKDRDAFVRLNTCKGLGSYGPVARDAVPALLAMLRGLDDEVFEDKEGKRLRGNPRNELENAAVVALRLMTGKQFQTVGAFLAWYDYENPDKK